MSTDKDLAMTGLVIPKIHFQQEVLPNGLQVILRRNNRVPLVHISLHYLVGSSYEVPGLSGFAHLFEHMMFQGSENVPKNGHGQYVDEAGGRWNASTSKDRTNYYETLPSNCLELGLWLEADRLSSLQVTEENFENQRQTVIEEKKQSYDNQPYGFAYLRFDDLAYENWGYAHPVIGSLEDLEGATLDDAREFHQTYYGPGNAVLVLSGNLDESCAMKMVNEHFGSIKNRTQAKPPVLYEPVQKHEKREEIHDPLAVLPMIILGYHMPPMGTPDYYALTMLSLILADGSSSRLYRQLIYERSWVASLSAGPNQYRGPGLFAVWMQIQEGVQAEPVMTFVDKELEQLCQDLVSSEEMEKARNQVAFHLVRRLEKVSDVGEILAHHSVFYGDTEMVNREWNHYARVTPEEICRVAQETFVSENKTLLLVKPDRG